MFARAGISAPEKPVDAVYRQTMVMSRLGVGAAARRVPVAAALILLVLAGCTTHHREPSQASTATASVAAPTSEPDASSASSSACGTSALPADSPNPCEAPPGYTGPLECTAAAAQAHPAINQPAVIEITTVMGAELHVVARDATFSAAQDVQANGQGHARISFDINRAAVGVLVNVEVTAHLQDAPEADCATTFTPVAATPGDQSP